MNLVWKLRKIQKNLDSSEGLRINALTELLNSFGVANRKNVLEVLVGTSDDVCRKDLTTVYTANIVSTSSNGSLNFRYVTTNDNSYTTTTNFLVTNEGYTSKLVVVV